MKTKVIIIKILRKTYRFFSSKEFSKPKSDLNRQSANEKIYNLLIRDEPCMIARFGTTELLAINNYLCIQEDKPVHKKILNFITGNTNLPWWQMEIFKYIDIYSGVFNPTEEIMIKFSERYLKDIPLIDILGSFQYGEKFMPLKENVIKVHLETLYPFFVERPWTEALKGKKVLVVHPFEETILKQYELRNKLFQNKDILPEFELYTIKAVQSAVGIKPAYKDWFEALEDMENQISKIDFDICIIGCGAYGMPLAAHVKRIGKKAFHIGGGLQLLFGIKGKRWDDPDYLKLHNIPEFYQESYKDLYNSYWTRPLKKDTPKSASKLDSATYW